jgi:SNF2 family DNA or RNA helicase
LKLRQVCCDPRLVNVDAARGVEGSAKLDALLALISASLAEGRRILVFSQFARMLALVSEALLARGHGHVTLTGATQDRGKPIDAFQQGRADVFLISLKAGGAGLNLVGADTVIHYDPWWNPAAQAQATDRAHRIGQDKPVFVHDLIAAGSVEERMLALQRHKRRLASAVLDGRGLPPAGSSAAWRCDSSDGRGLRPAGSSAAWRCDSIDGRGLPPAGSSAAWRSGSIDGSPAAAGALTETDIDELLAPLAPAF